MSENRSVKLLRALLPMAMSCTALSAPCAIASADNGMSRKEELHRYLYHIYSFQKRYADAEKEVAAVSALAPHDPKIQGEFGRKLFDDKLFKEAYPHMVKATQLDQYTAAYWANRGACEMQIGRYREAVDSFRKAVQSQRGQENYSSQLASAQTYYQHQVDEANYKRMQEQKKKDDDE